MKCEERVWDSKSWYSSQCTRNAIVERNGKHYCKIHDPEYIKDKVEKQNQAYESMKCKGCGINPFDTTWSRTFKYCPYCGTKREVN
jgi:hypothetical protein